MEKEEIKELKEILINFSSIIAGVLAVIIIGAILLLMFFAMGLFGWSDGGQYAERLEVTTTISLILTVFISCFAGGYLTAKISTKNHYTYITFTAIILLLAFFISNNFDFQYYYFEDFLYMAAAPIFIFIGGWYKIRLKKSISSNTPSSQTGTAEQ